MDRGLMAHTGRLTAILMAGASLAACASLTTPQYSIRDGAEARPDAHREARLGGAGGSATRPSIDPSARGTNAPYQVGGIWYVPHDQPHYDETGIASWYGDAFNMKATATGEIFDMTQFSAAHTTLPLPSMVEVTNLDNGRKMTVRVNDRGPFVGGRIIDLSRAAAQELGYDRAGTAHVRVRYVGPAPLAGPEAGVRYAKADPSMAPQPQRAVARSARRPADEDIFEEARLTPVSAPISAPVSASGMERPLVAPPEPVAVSSLSALPPAPRGPREVPARDDHPRDRLSRDAYVSDVVAHRSSPASAATVTAQNDRTPIAQPPYRIQAGAFSDEDNARKAAARLASAGTATVEPFDRSGVTFYRVYLPAPSDEAEAYAVRDKVAAIGFADARVVRP